MSDVGARVSGVVGNIAEAFSRPRTRSKYADGLIVHPCYGLARTSQGASKPPPQWQRTNSDPLCLLRLKLEHRAFRDWTGPPSTV